MKKGFPEKLFGFLFIYILIFQTAFSQELPLYVAADLYDASKPDNLGLERAEGTETIRVFSPTNKTDKFSNNVVMTAFKGVLYCQWQSSEVGEDGPDSWVAYSTSKDGKKWSKPKVLAESIADGYCAPGGWWIYGDTLIAFINTWPVAVVPRGGYTRYVESTDGKHWSDPKAVTMQNGDTLQAVLEQDPHALPNGRMISAAHFQPGLIVNPVYTDDPKGVSDWVRAEFENISTDEVSRCIEPSNYIKANGDLVMIFRDQKSSFVKFASVSQDQGASWTKPIATEVPDARTKQSAGNFPNGQVYLAGNPVQQKERIPLVLTISKDGESFDKAFLLRAGGGDLQTLRSEGKAKRPGYHYPKSFVHDGYLYVSYSTNKEDVEFTRVPLAHLEN